MFEYILRRLLMLVPVMLGVATVVFLVIHISPGDPILLMLGADATPEAIAELRHELGLDQPLYMQYFKWLGNMLKGDFGRSIWMDRPVLPEVLRRFKATIILAAFGLIVATILGIIIGVISGIKQYSIFDKISMLFALFGVSMPVFWLGLMFIIFFGVKLGWLPVSGMHSPAGGGFFDMCRHLILPGLALSARSVGIVARLTRSTVLDVIRLDYVRTARAKGLNQLQIISRHVIKNTLIPVVTVIGAQAGILLSGAVLVETVFAWPGLGRLMYQGILRRDFPLVQGAVLFSAGVFALVNLLVDLSYTYLDPRIKYK